MKRLISTLWSTPCTLQLVAVGQGKACASMSQTTAAQAHRSQRLKGCWSSVEHWTDVLDMFLFGLRLRSRSSSNMPKLTGKDMRPCSARTTRAAHLGIMWGTGRIGNAFCATSNPFLRYLFSIDQLFLVVLSGWLAQPTSSFCTGYILSRELCKDQLYLIGATHELLRIVPEINPSKYSLGLQLSTGNHLQLIWMIWTFPGWITRW